MNFYSCRFHNFCRETVLWSVHSTPSTGCSGGESHCGPPSIGWWLTRDTILTVSHQEHAFGNNITSFHLALKIFPLCNVFSLHLFKGNWLKDSCASHIEHCPCSTINLCQAKTQYKAALRKVSKLVVSDLQLCVWNLKWSSSLGIPPSPPILSLSANLSVRQKMYTAP